MGVSGKDGDTLRECRRLCWIACERDRLRVSSPPPESRKPKNESSGGGWKPVSLGLRHLHVHEELGRNHAARDGGRPTHKWPVPVKHTSLEQVIRLLTL